MAAISTSPEKKRERHGFRRRKTRTAAAIEYVMEVRSAARTPFNPWNIALSEILPAVGCHRLSHCGKALCDQILQLTGRRKSGNCLRAEQVNGSLHNHCTGCGDGKLECHRNAHRELMAGICRMKLPVVFFRPHIRHGAINIKRQSTAEIPWEKTVAYPAPATPILKRMMRSRSRRTFNTAEKSGTSAESGCFLLHADRRKADCKNRSDQATADNHNIGISVLKNIFRCVHEMQQWPHGDHAEECQDNCEKESQ